MDERQDAVGGTTRKQYAPATAPQGEPAINLEKLADKVYRLMRDEMRLAQARGERDTRCRRR
jgi:hypothetical protein